MNIQIERATRIMEMWAEDAAHGYDQAQRWGERGDFDDHKYSGLLTEED